jgi:hypothetical protein
LFDVLGEFLCFSDLLLFLLDQLDLFVISLRLGDIMKSVIF